MDDIPMCGHTKIKWVTWTNEHHSTSGKFMCLDCNTDFVQMTREIREFLFEKEHQQMIKKIEENPEHLRSEFGVETYQRGSEGGWYEGGVRFEYSSQSSQNAEDT